MQIVGLNKIVLASFVFLNEKLNISGSAVMSNLDNAFMSNFKNEISFTLFIMKI